jgi:hypothetical protein
MQNKMPPDIGMGPGPQVGFVGTLLEVTNSLWNEQPYIHTKFKFLQIFNVVQE